MTENIIQFLIDNKLAKNELQGSHLATGLQLWQCKSDAEILERAARYRAWRNSGVYGKATQPCYEHAIKGDVVPELAINEPTASNVMKKLLRTENIDLGEYTLLQLNLYDDGALTVGLWKDNGDDQDQSIVEIDIPKKWQQHI